jgi:diamine N-acetyltransferase
MINIRKAKPIDLDQIYQVYLEYDDALVNYLSKDFKILRNKKEPKKKMIKKGLLKDVIRKNECFMVAENGKKIVGFIHGYAKVVKHPIFETHNIGFFEDICILKKYRGKGIATKLWHEMLEFYKKNKCTVVELRVMESNPARNIYEKWGFENSHRIMRKKI